MNAIITGATKGIGRAIAEKFAEENINLAVCARSKDDLNSLKEELKDIDVNTQVVDVSNADAVKAFGTFCLEQFDQIDCLINNAGVFIPGDLADEDEHQLVKMLHAYPQGGSYSISKFALTGFSKNLRLELKESGIKVTTVYPGATWSNSWSGSGVEPERIMEANDIAESIYALFNLSDRAVVEDIILRPQLGDL